MLTHDVALCPVATLDSYINARDNLVNAALHDELLRCYRKPHGPATIDTLARWVKMILHYSGAWPTIRHGQVSCSSRPKFLGQM